MITLTSVYRDPEAVDVQLYKLLRERTPEMSISHKLMPTFDQHMSFIRSIPYYCWYTIRDGATVVGSVYLTRAREVGIFIFKEHHGKGYGRQAVEELRRRHPGRMLANINPANKASLAFFSKMGARLIQFTFEIQ